MEIIDGYISSFKAKYLYMDKVFGDKLTKVDKRGKQVVDTANIYINFESLFNCLRNEYIEKQLENCTKKDLKDVYRSCISNFINVAAHYRKYFFKNKIKTNIFFFYNEIPELYEDYNNCALVSDYRFHYFKTLTSLNRVTINALVQESIPFMRIICDYIEDVYMISSNRIESSALPFLIDTENKFPSNINILITKDVYDYQYVNQNWLVITKYGKESVLLTKKNIIQFLKFKMKYEHEQNINADLLTFIIACLGDRKRSIPSIPGFKFARIYKSILELYAAGYIYDADPDSFNIVNLSHIMNKASFAYLKKENVAERILCNYRVCDIIYQYEQASENQKDMVLNQLITKTDPKALMELNEKYFEDHPLMLLELNNYHKKYAYDKELGINDDGWG